MLDMDNMFGGSGVQEGADNGLVFDLAGVDENANSFEAIPKGKYPAFIDELDFGESKSGAPMITVKYKISDGEYENRVIFDYISFSEKAVQYSLPKLKKLLVRVVPEYPLAGFNPQDFSDSGVAIGKECIIDVNTKKEKKGDYAGEIRNTLKDVLAPDSFGGGSFL